MVRSFVMFVMLAACGTHAQQDRELVDAVRPLVGADQATRERSVDTWKLDRATWATTVVAPYDALYDEYSRAFDAAAPALVEQLANGGARSDVATNEGTIVTRRHFAGDPALTRGQARARWALPVQFPSELASIDGVPIDAVFVRAGGRWHAIIGIDRIVRMRTAALDAVCARMLDVLGSKACQEVSWEIAEAALRADTTRLDHACSLARSQCAGS